MAHTNNKACILKISKDEREEEDEEEDEREEREPSKNSQSVWKIINEYVNTTGETPISIYIN